MVSLLYHHLIRSLPVIEFNVNLSPNTTYTLGLNSATNTAYDNFKDTAGNALVPVVWKFTTAP